jgi:mannosyltransferase OCH1-like enzyme
MNKLKNKAIPKIIHFCWFGGKPLSALGKKCLASWEKYLPEYQIMRWDENNFDVNSVPYTKESYQLKKYAFVSDYVRYKVLYDFGGIYMDTDVEVLKNLDEFLENEAFTGFEDEQMVAPGLILGSVQGNSLIKDMVEIYQYSHFVNLDNTLNLKTGPQILTELLLNRGLEKKDEYQKISGLSIYPKEYFCPKSWITLKLDITPNTFTIHHYEGTWIPKFQKFKKYIRNLLGIYKV